MRLSDVCFSQLDAFRTHVGAASLTLESPLAVDNVNRVDVSGDQNGIATLSHFLPAPLASYFDKGAQQVFGFTAPWQFSALDPQTLIIRAALQVSASDLQQTGSRRRQFAASDKDSRFWLALKYEREIPAWLRGSHSSADDIQQRAVFEKLMLALSQMLDLLISHAAMTIDPLTQLHSRAVLQTEIAGLTKRHATGLLMIHCRDLHTVNQFYGHAAGDRMITQVAEALSAITRDSDILCRFGGALFGVSFAVNSASDAMDVASKIQQHLQSVRYLDGEKTLTFNIGVAVNTEADSSLEGRESVSTLISRADHALKAAEQHSDPTISLWQDNDAQGPGTTYSYLGGIFTADTSTDYRNMLLLWDISSIIADENDFERLLQQVINRLAKSFDFIQAGLLGTSEVADKAYTYEINPYDEAEAISHEIPLSDRILAPLASEVVKTGKATEFDNGHIVALVVPLGIDTEDCFYMRSETGRFPITEDTKVLLVGLTRQLGKALRRARLETKLNQQLVHQKEQLQHEVAQLREDLQGTSMVYKSTAMQQLMRQAQRAAVTDTTILITGESGTGKERLMHAVHHLSPRSDKPFVIVDCGAIPETLIESELFGHAKGAFTGALRQVKGKILEANGGTLALDEIGELPLAMQTKLLRFVQEKHFTPVGSNELITVDVKIIAVTNRDLADDVNRGLFRKDLFYRLNVVTLRNPPLRERPDDIPLLASHFLNRFATQFDTERKHLTNDALMKMQRYSWPGNIREMENKLMQATLLAEGNLIDWPALALEGELSAASLPESSSPLPLPDSTPEKKGWPADAMVNSSPQGNEGGKVNVGESANATVCLENIKLALRALVAEAAASHHHFNAPVGEWVEEEIIRQTYQHCGSNVRTTAARLQLSLSTARRRINKIEGAVDGATDSRPPAWHQVVLTLHPITCGDVPIKHCFQTLKLILLQELLDIELASLSQAAVMMGISEPTLYKLKRQLPVATAEI